MNLCNLCKPLCKCWLLFLIQASDCVFQVIWTGDSCWWKWQHTERGRWCAACCYWSRRQEVWHLSAWTDNTLPCSRATGRENILPLEWIAETRADIVHPVVVSSACYCYCCHYGLFVVYSFLLWMVFTLAPPLSFDTCQIQLTVICLVVFWPLFFLEVYTSNKRGISICNSPTRHWFY